MTQATHTAPGTFKFRSEIPVRWGDQDAYGHVNNALYIRYLEEARVQLLASLGDMVTGSIAPVVINVGCTFLRPIVYPATIVVDCYIGDIGRSSFMVNYRLHTLDDSETLYSEGYSKVVWMDHSTGRSVPLPDSVREQIS